MVSGACNGGQFAKAVQCGFFAAHPDVRASGCQLSPAALETSDDYLRHFFRAATAEANGDSRKRGGAARDALRRALVRVGAPRGRSDQLHDHRRADRRLLRRASGQAARVAHRRGDPERGAGGRARRSRGRDRADGGARARDADPALRIRRAQPRGRREARRRARALLGRTQPDRRVAVQARAADARAADRVCRPARARSRVRARVGLRKAVAAAVPREPRGLR